MTERIYTFPTTVPSIVIRDRHFCRHRWILEGSNTSLRTPQYLGDQSRLIMAESLPQELVDAVIDDVRSFSDLKACSLTCHTFSARTRAILFREVKLSGRSQLDAFQRFHELCVESPHIPSLVQTLCIHDYRRGSALPGLRPTFDTVNSILHFMQNLKVIKFYDVTISDFCDGSLARLSSHSFREIHLYDVVFHENGFDQLCAVLQGSPDLERLFVHHTGPTTVSMFGGDDTNQPRLNHLHATRRGPRIRDLSVVSRYSYSCPAFIGAILETKTCPVSVEKLRRFAFSLSKTVDFQHLVKILKLTSGTLRVLLLTFNCPSAWHSLPLSGLPIVRIGHLRKVAFMVTSGHDGPHYLQWWIQSLRRVIQSNQSPVLRTMDIELGASFVDNPASQSLWAEFDQILSSPPFDKKFRMLTIKVQKRSPNESPQNKLPQFIWDLGVLRSRETTEDKARQLKAQFHRLGGQLKFSIKVIKHGV
ncbi:hypothetical protein EDD18DRAFT_1128193 [Armillaria luteobubalina]|uniref:F-box domain-containing protein n=1 Tax=Armillaria luteobubalina TaxID=153913 RepID=A0AA39UZY0_9AGAR|nr:hypothetical protein EDD18DRAFT_1128193 [Armillaria luteobubalina]